MNRAVPSDFSYVRSDNSGTSIPAEPAERVASENVCPILEISCSVTFEEEGWVVASTWWVPALRNLTAETVEVDLKPFQMLEVRLSG